MKISLYTRISDLIPAKETFFDHVNDLIFNDPKRKMFKIHSIDSIFNRIKQAGVDGLELICPGFLTDEKIKKIRQIANAHKLEIFSIHQSNKSLLGIDLMEIERLCGIAKRFFANVIVLHINALGKKLSEQTFLTKLKNLQREYDVTFAIENVAKSPFTLAKEMYKGKEFSRTMKFSGLAITFDTTHLGQADDDICEFYKNNKEKIVNIHISDYRKSWLNRVLFLANGTHLPLMKGELPITKFLKTLKEENYKGFMTMEVNGNLNQLCQSAEIIKNSLLL